MPQAPLAMLESRAVNDEERKMKHESSLLVRIWMFEFGGLLVSLTFAFNSAMGPT